MTSPSETSRLLHWMPIIARWSGLTPEERQFCIGMRGHQKRNPAFVPSPGAIRWMQRLVARFQAAMLADPIEADQTNEVTR